MAMAMWEAASNQQTERTSTSMSIPFAQLSQTIQSNVASITNNNITIHYSLDRINGLPHSFGREEARIDSTCDSRMHDTV